MKQKLRTGEKILLLTLFAMCFTLFTIGCYEEAFVTYHEAELQSTEITITSTEIFNPQPFILSLLSLTTLVFIVFYQITIIKKLGLFKTKHEEEGGE